MQRRRAAPAVRAAAAAEPAAAPAGGPGGLSVREERLPGCATRLHVTVPAEQCRAAYTKFMNSLRKGTAVDGFRKGKAPDAALIAHVGGMSRVLNSVLADMLEPAVAQVGGGEGSNVAFAGRVHPLGWHTGLALMENCLVRAGCILTVPVCSRRLYL